MSTMVKKQSWHLQQLTNHVFFVRAKKRTDNKQCRKYIKMNQFEIFSYRIVACKVNQAQCPNHLQDLNHIQLC
jgi:hypothetical protein